MLALLALFVVVLVGAGAGLTYLCRLDLKLEERVAYGVPIGAVVVSLLGFGTGWAMGFGGTSVAVALVLTAAVSVPGWWLGRGHVVAEATDVVRRRPWELAVLLVPSWIVAVFILRAGYSTDGSGTIYAGQLTTWTDWQAHLTYASSFAHADNFPPGLPTAVGEDLGYHFGIDFFAALFVPLGLDVTDALIFSSGVIAFAFPAVMYLVGVRLLGGRLPAAVSTVLFVTFGGLGWVEFVRDASNEGLAIIWSLPNDYTRYQELNYWVENPVTGVLYPQRPTLIGFSILLVAIGVLWTARREDRGPAPWLAAGVLVGLLPLFHLFSWGTAFALGAIWAVLDRRREWLWYLVPALVLALPVAVWLLPPERGWELGLWVTAERGGRDENVMWFWFKNMGLFLPLLAVAQLWGKGLSRTLVIASIPIWLWLLVPNVIVPTHASDFNNTHFFVYVLLLGSFLVGGLLVAVARTWPLATPVIVLAFSTMTFAGALDLWKAADPEADIWPIQVMDGAAVDAAEWARGNTDDDAVFVAAPSHLQAVSALGGRTLVMGFPGWVFDLGIPDWREREDDTRTMLSGGPATEELLDRYGVDYVQIGQLERDQFGADDAYWEERGTVVYDSDGYRIYAVGA